MFIRCVENTSVSVTTGIFMLFSPNPGVFQHLKSEVLNYIYF